MMSKTPMVEERSMDAGVDSGAADFQMAGLPGFGVAESTAAHMITKQRLRVGERQTGSPKA